MHENARKLDTEERNIKWRWSVYWYNMRAILVGLDKIGKKGFDGTH